MHDLPRPKMWRQRSVSTYNGGVCRSDDGGRSWHVSNVGMPQTAVTHLILCARPPQPKSIGPLQRFFRLANRENLYSAVSELAFRVVELLERSHAPARNYRLHRQPPVVARGLRFRVGSMSRWFLIVVPVIFERVLVASEADLFATARIFRSGEIRMRVRVWLRNYVATQLRIGNRHMSGRTPVERIRACVSFAG